MSRVSLSTSSGKTSPPRAGVELADTAAVDQAAGRLANDAAVGQCFLQRGYPRVGNLGLAENQDLQASQLFEVHQPVIRDVPPIKI